MFQAVTSSTLDMNAVTKTAGAMIQRDWIFIILCYPIIVFAPLFVTGFELANTSAPLILAVIERLGQLIFIFLAAKRWLTLLSVKTISLNGAIHFFSIGLAIWFMFTIPLTL